MGIAGEVARWMVELEWEDIPERIIAKAKLQLLNVLASLHAGYHTEEGRAVLRSLAGSSGPVRAVPSGQSMHHLDALCADACLSMVLDYDDYLFLGHTGHSAVNVPLVLGEMLSSSPRELLAAQIIANEVAGRMGAAVALGPRNGQMWSYIHHAGGACAAARLLGLDAERAEQALAIALYQPNLALFPGFMGGQAKTATAAWPVLTGVRSAFLAREGLRGEPSIIEGPRGFLAEFAFAGAPFMFTGLGRAWVTDTIAFKPYPGCAYIDTSVDALLQIMGRYESERGEPLSPQRVEAVEVRASVLTMRMNELSRDFEASDPLAPININFSIPKSLALAIMDGGLSGSSLAGKRLRADGARILDLARRIDLRHDWELTGKVVGSLDDALGFADVLDQFTLRQLTRTALSLREHFSAQGFSLQDMRERREALPTHLRRDILKVLGGKLIHPMRETVPGGYTYDLGGVDMDALRLPFPALVTLRSTDGFRDSAQVDIPYGAPGSDDTDEVVREKFRREASRSLPEDRIEKAIALVGDFETSGLMPLLDACCV
ncbi:MAG: MmgE/PrpD family protein [Actinobacteria bacterium]|nr:MmgE/PrpD family protein [Actinomycetota bacterium]